MSWWQTIPVVLVTLLVFFVPGLAVLGAAGARRLNLLALAIPVSTTVASLVAVSAPLLRLRFDLVSYGIASAIVACVVIAVRAFARKRDARSQRSFGLARLTRGPLTSNGPVPRAGYGRAGAMLAIPVGFAVGAWFIAKRLVSAFGAPDHFSQTFDNVFHLNAVQHIALTADGSSLTLGNLTAASAGFYPAAMHDMMALVAMATGAAIPVVVNICVLILAAVAWPLGCIFLVSRIVGYRPLPLVLAGALSAGLSGSPYLLIGFGVLYPLFAAMVLLPTTLGLIIETLRLSPRKSRSFVAAPLALAAVLPGLALTHPSAVVALMAFTVPLLAARLLLTWARPASRGTRIFWSLAFPLYILVLYLVWRVARPDLTFAPWGATQTTSGAIGEVAAASPLGAITAWVYLAFTLVGIYVVLRWQRSRWWVAAIYLVAGILYVFGAGWGSGSLRTFMVGVWYNDPFRLAALLPAVTLPVVVIGAEWALRTGRRALELGITRVGRPGSFPARGRRVIGGVTVSIIVLSLAAATQSGALKNVQQRIDSVFRLDDQSDLLTPDELEVLRAVPRFVPQDGVVVVNPFTGASLVYALAERKALPPHMFGTRSADEQLLLDHWDEAAYRQDVCPVIRRLNAYWALDFGMNTVIETDERYRGLADVIDGTAPAVDELFRVGDARLVKISACA